MRINVNHINLDAIREEQEAIHAPSAEELKPREKGPWTAVDYDGKVGLQSDDFHHDVVLYINGDFYSHEQKLEYARLLADRMNRMPPE